jgi:hypothetical protein
MDFQLDETQWPLVQARWTSLEGGTLTAFLKRMDSWLARKERFGLLLDSRGAGPMPPEQRKLVLDHMRANAALTAKYFVQAVVIDNLVQRTLFHAIRLVFPSPFPNRIFSDPDAARSWLNEQLQAR